MANLTDALKIEAADAISITDQLIPMEVHGLEGALVHLMGAVWLELRKPRAFGSRYTRIFPITLDGVNPSVILPRDDDGLVRHVQIGVDSAVGGAFPTIRVGLGSVSVGGGGILLSAGQLHDFGELGGDIALQAVSDASITLYVLSRA